MSVNPASEELAHPPGGACGSASWSRRADRGAQPRGATATVALNKVTDDRRTRCSPSSTRSRTQGRRHPEYSGGPQTFLMLGSDRRAGSKDAYDRDRPAAQRHDPARALRPRTGTDLGAVDPARPDGQHHDRQRPVLPAAKRSTPRTRSAASWRRQGRRCVLAAETIEREVFPGLKLNGIVDVNFTGFIEVVDTLGCAYVNVDHRYYNDEHRHAGNDYSASTCSPAIRSSATKTRSTTCATATTTRTSCASRASRTSCATCASRSHPANELGQIDTSPRPSGTRSRPPSRLRDELIELAKLIAFSQGKPLRQVKFQTANVNCAAQRRLLRDRARPSSSKRRSNNFLHGDEQLQPGLTPAPSSQPCRHAPSPRGAAPRRASLDLVPTSPAGDAKPSRPRSNVPFRVLYPTLQTGAGRTAEVRPYTLSDQQGTLHHAYVVVWQQNIIGGYYDFEGTDWLNPPLVAHPASTTIDGAHIHDSSTTARTSTSIAWRQAGPLLAHQHAARGTHERADARDRALGAAAALDVPLRALGLERPAGRAPR